MKKLRLTMGLVALSSMVLVFFVTGLGLAENESDNNKNWLLYWCGFAVVWGSADMSPAECPFPNPGPGCWHPGYEIKGSWNGASNVPAACYYYSCWGADPPSGCEGAAYSAGADCALNDLLAAAQLDCLLQLLECLGLTDDPVHVGTGRKFFAFEPDFQLALANGEVFDFDRVFGGPYYDDRLSSLPDGGDGAEQSIQFVDRFPSFGDGWGHDFSHQMIFRGIDEGSVHVMVRDPFGVKHFFGAVLNETTIVDSFRGIDYTVGVSYLAQSTTGQAPLYLVTTRVSEGGPFVSFDLFVDDKMYRFSYDWGDQPHPILSAVYENGRQVASITYQPDAAMVLLQDSSGRVLQFKSEDGKITSINLLSKKRSKSEVLATFLYDGAGNLQQTDTLGGTESFLYSPYLVGVQTFYHMTQYTNRYGGTSTMSYALVDDYPRLVSFDGPEVGPAGQSVLARSYDFQASYMPDAKGLEDRIIQDHVAKPEISSLDEYNFSTITHNSTYTLNRISEPGKATKDVLVARTGICADCDGSKGKNESYIRKDETKVAITVTEVGTHTVIDDTRYGHADGTLDPSEEGAIETRLAADGVFLKVKFDPLYPVQRRTLHDDVEVDRTSWVYSTLPPGVDPFYGWYNEQKPIRELNENHLTGERTLAEYVWNALTGKPETVVEWGFVDAAGNPISPDDPVYISNYTYDPTTGAMLTAEDRLGQFTEYSYFPSGPDAGFLQSTSRYPGVSPTPLVTTFADYDLFGNAGTVTDENGNIRYYEYDSVGRQTRLVDVALDLETQFVYDSTTETQIVLDSSGGSPVELYRSVKTYDADGRLVREALPDGAVIRYLYDSVGHLMYEAVVPAGETDPSYYVQYDYDEDGNRTAVILPSVYFESPSLAAYAYDDAGNVVRVTDGNGYVTLNEYDLYGRPVGFTPPDTVNTTSLAYDMNGNLTDHQVVTPSKDVLYSIQFGYDGHGNLKTIVSPDFGSVSILRQQLADGWHTTKTYAASGRTEETVADWAGRPLTQAFNGDDLVVSYLYDLTDSTNGMGRVGRTVISEDGLPQEQLDYDYNARGQLSTITRQYALKTWTTGWGYRTDGALETMTYPTGTTVSYNPAATPWGQPSQIVIRKDDQDHPLADLVFAPGGGPLESLEFNSRSVSEQHYYDPAYRTTGITVTAQDEDAPITAVSRTYAYDGAGNITEIEDLLDSGLTYAYTYDEVNRLTGAVATNLEHEYSYDYGDDGLGNRRTATVDGVWSRYHYADELQPGASPMRLRVITDRDGNLVHEYRYDDEGRVVYRDGDLLSYDDRGQLSAYQPSGTPGDQYEYRYDDQGRRVQKRLPDGTMILYHYDQEGHLIAETDQNGVPQAEYVWVGWRPVALIVTETTGDDDDDDDDDDNNDNNDDDNDDCGGCPSFLLDADDDAPERKGTEVTIYAIHTDHLGTPVAMTDESGQVAWRLRLSPFGEPVELDEDADGDGTPVTLNLRFPGQYFDAESGLHYNWWRYYDPAVGAFLAPDPVEVQSAYQYAGNNPLAHLDFYGLVCISDADIDRSVREADWAFSVFMNEHLTGGWQSSAGVFLKLLCAMGYDWACKELNQWRGYGCIGAAEALVGWFSKNPMITKCCAGRVYRIHFYHSIVLLRCSTTGTDRRIPPDKSCPGVSTREKQYDPWTGTSW